VRTVDVQRVVDVLDFVSDATMNAIDEALRLHLGL
jgi:mRNA-degrading endonuclease toxin of MazEF toxin-antitoxin module